MTDLDYKYKCPPPKYPAEQPHKPGGDCPWRADTKCPDLKEPAPCPDDPDHECKCPERPPADKGCLEKLIDGQTDPITKGDKAKAFKTELEALLTKAKAASLEYTRDKYDKLVKQWVEQDCEIADVIRMLECTVSCWRCLIECHVCPLLYEMRDAERRLFGDGTLPMKVGNLHELLCCQTQDKAAKERAFNRIKAVLAVWEKPAQTIEKLLADNAKRIADARKALGAESSKAVFDVFLRLVPLHLAIAPPKGPEWTTKIAREYTEFCHCDKGTPDCCCGPDVGELSFRERLIGVQPYLIDPNDYFKVICCLVEKHYQPAKDRLSEAESAVTNTESLIKRNEAVITDGLKNFDTSAKAAIPTVIDCSKYEPYPTENRHG